MVKTKVVRVGEMRAELKKCRAQAPGNEHVEISLGDGFQAGLKDQGWSPDQVKELDLRLKAVLPFGSEVDWEKKKKLLQVDVPAVTSSDPVLDVAAALQHVIENPAARGFVFGQAAQTAQAAALVPAGPLAGQIYVFAGKLEHCNREQAEKIVHDLGGKTADDVAAGVTCVVAGEKAGAKAEKARQLNIKVLSEQQFGSLVAFYAMVGHSGASNILASVFH